MDWARYSSSSMIKMVSFAMFVPYRMLSSKAPVSYDQVCIGILMRKVVPLPSWLITSILPP